MTDQDIHLLKHLAERVEGLSEWIPPSPWSTQPSGTYKAEGHGIRIRKTEQSPLRFVNPLKDANEALWLLEGFSYQIRNDAGVQCGCVRV